MSNAKVRARRRRRAQHSAATARAIAWRQLQQDIAQLGGFGICYGHFLTGIALPLNVRAFVKAVTFVDRMPFGGMVRS